MACETLVGIVLGFLQFGERFVYFSGFEIKDAEFKADQQIGRIFFRARFAFLQLEGIAFGGDLGGFLGIIRRAGIQLRNLVVKAFNFGGGDLLLEGRIVPAFHFGHLLEILNGAVEVVLLRVNLGHIAQQLEIVRLVFDASFVIFQQLVAGVAGFDLAVLLFQLHGFGFVLENIAVGAFAAGERAVAAFIERFAGRNVLELLVDFAVVGVRPAECVENLFRFRFLARGDPGIGELESNVFVVGRIAVEHVKGHDGGAGHVEGEGGFSNHFVGAGVVGVRVQHLLGSLDGFERTFAKRQLGLGDHGGGTGAAEGAFEETGLGAALAVLRAAQSLATFVIGRFLDEDLVKQFDGVIKVFPLKRFVTFGVNLPQFSGQII